MKNARELEPNQGKFHVVLIVRVTPFHVYRYWLDLELIGRDVRFVVVVKNCWTLN